MCGDFITASFESHHIHCCESRSRVLTDACRSVKLPAEDCCLGLAEGKVALVRSTSLEARLLAVTTLPTLALLQNVLLVKVVVTFLVVFWLCPLCFLLHYSSIRGTPTITQI